MAAVREITAADVKNALRRRHHSDTPKGEWVCVEEAFSGFSTWSGGIDLLAIGAWRTSKVGGCPGAGGHKAQNPVVAYEVKVSRADMRRELYGYAPGPDTARTTRPVPAWPIKASEALRFSEFFMFAVPQGLLMDHEVEKRSPWTDAEAQQFLDAGGRQRDRMLWLPPEAGLVELCPDGRITVRAEATMRVAEPFTRHMTAELIRHVADPNKLRQMRVKMMDLERQNADLRALLTERVE